MAITIRRILIDENGTARVFYAQDNGPAGADVLELKDTAELTALTLLVQGNLGKKVAAMVTPDGREAARAERIARLEARRLRPR